MSANIFYSIVSLIYFFIMVAYCYLAIKDYKRTTSIIRDIKDIKRREEDESKN